MGNQNSIIFFDMETLSKGPKIRPNPQWAEIFQLGAVSMKRNGDSFEEYFLPPNLQGNIPTYSKIKHNFKKIGNTLYKDDEEVHWMGIKQGLEMFMEFLRRAAGSDGVVYLIAHNGSYFDFPILKNNLRHYDVAVPDGLTINLLDSLPFVRSEGYRSK